MKTILVWFRADLRVYDHPALAAACDTADRVVPLFILDDAILQSKRASANRNRFLLECLADLRANLQKRGGDLIVRRGKADEVLREVAAETDATTIHYTIDYTSYARARDKQITESLHADGIDLQAFPGKLAVDSFKGITAANGNIYKVFTPFWKNWSTIDRRPLVEPPKDITVPSSLNSGRLPAVADITESHDLSHDVLKGGESAGRLRMHEFVGKSVQDYAKMHDTLTPDGTSRLSMYLHFGCVSVREIEELLEERGPADDGAARFHRQLAWRDFYNYILFHYPDNAKLEFQERYRDMDWEPDAGDKLLKAWEAGQTGYPIIDAAMRQLTREGWMHNRARLIVGSFLTKDLQLDWRSGESVFLRWLLDGDQALNNGNWQWIASVGVDPAPVFRRLYNPMTQQKRYDEDGSYVKYYVPELADVPDKYLAEPWKMSVQEQAAANCKIGTDYPAPIVDHASARKQTLDRYRR